MPKSTCKSSKKKTPEKPRFCKRYKNIEDMPVINRHAAGIDLGGDVSHFVAVEAGDEVEVKEFGGMTPDLRALVEYLKTYGVTTAAMEATGVYWVPVYDLLEAAGFEVYLVNPSHVKNVPGRPKDDKLDSRWLQKLHKYGLLQASFRPSEDIRPLRSLQRQRTTLVRQSSSQIQRMQKALDIMNVRIHKAISDICGVTGQRIIRSIIAGERDPAVLAAMREPNCKSTEDELKDALTGNYNPFEVTALRQALEHYDFIVRQIGELDEVIESYLLSLIPMPDVEIAERIKDAHQPLPIGKHVPHYNAAAYVELFTGYDPTCLPGIGPQIALGLLSELGRDMTKWPTDKRFGSYLGLAPQKKISGGKVLKSKTRLCDHHGAVLFRQAAAAVTREDSALGAYYRRLAVRIGKAKALIATAHKIARMYYHLMKDGRAYVEIGEKAYEEKYRKQQIATLHKRAERLGFAITPLAA